MPGTATAAAAEVAAGGDKKGIHAALDLLHNIRVKLPQPGAKNQANQAVAQAAKDKDAVPRTGAIASNEASSSNILQEIAGIIMSMAKDSFGGMLTHPGHATLGVYYLAKKHQMEGSADHIDGTHAGDAELVGELIRYVDISDSIYPDRYPLLVEQEKVIEASDIMYWNKEVHKLQPGFYIAKDPPRKQLLWVLRGTHDIHDLLTDLCGIATKLPQGGYAHWGMWQATAWLLEHHLDRVLSYHDKYPDYELVIVGHSMGAAVAALLAYMMHTDPELVKKMKGRSVRCIGVATAACMSSELCAAVTPYMKTLVMRHDMVPRFSTTSVAQLQQELLELDYKHLLVKDLTGHPVYQQAIGRASEVAAALATNRHAQAAASKAQVVADTVGPQMQALQMKAAAAAGGVAKALSKAKDGSKGSTPAAAAAAAPGEGGAAVAACGQSKEATAAPKAAGHVEVGEEREAAEEAAAAGELMDVALYAPGQLLYLRPNDVLLPDEEQTFTLLEGQQDARFQRIVLAPTCLTDHFPVAYKAALMNIQKQVQERVKVAADTAA